MEWFHFKETHDAWAFFGCSFVFMIIFICVLVELNGKK